MKNTIYYSVSEVATILLASTQTVRNYIKEGKLKATQKNPNESFKIKEKHLDKFLKKYSFSSGEKKNDKKKKKEPAKKTTKKKSKISERIKGVFYTPLSK